MANITETIYKHSPISCQNIFTSLYGIKLYHERYTPPWKNYYDNLLKTQHFSPREIESLQKKLLINLIKDAASHVPYYRDTVQLSPTSYSGNENTLQLLSSIPLLEKETVRNRNNEFLSQKFSPQSTIQLTTSGTTGTPLKIYVSPDGRKQNYAFFERSKNWANVNRFEKSATFGGRLVVPPHQKRPPFWRKNIIFNNTLFSNYHLSEQNLIHYTKKLSRLNPVIIDAYPSSISLIADFCIANSITTIRPRSIITSAEKLFNHQRIKIEKAFGCKVYDQYGCTEQAVFACQCSNGSYHVNTEYGILEVVDKNNNPVQDGELGEFVCTGFTNKAMPFIRYKIGDMGSLSTQQCTCGNNSPLIKKIHGRSTDVLITPDGRYITRLGSIFKDTHESIKESQIIQKELDLIEIYIVKSNQYIEEIHGERLIQELKNRLGSNMHYKLKYVTSIPRTNNGKIKAIINNLLK